MSRRAPVPPDPALWSCLVGLLRAMPGRLAAVMGLTLAGGLTEGVGLLMLVPLLGLAGLDAGQGELGGVQQLVASGFARLGLPPTLPAVLAVYLALVTLNGLLRRAESVLGLSLAYRLETLLRRRLYLATMRVSWLFFSRRRSSDFLQLLTTGAERAGDAARVLLHLISGGAVAAVYLLLALKLSLPLTGLVLLCSGALMLATRSWMGRAREAGREAFEAMKGLYAAIAEQLAGMRTARSYGAEEQHAALFGELTERVGRSYLVAGRSQADYSFRLEVGSAVALALLVYLAFEQLRIPTAEALLLLFLFARVVPRVTALQQAYQGLLTLLPTFQALEGMQRRCEEAAEPAHGRAAVGFRHELRLEAVSFAYEETPVLRELDLRIRPGETVALVGPSGAGKSTVADLVTGLLRPDGGRVLVDGVELGPDNLAAWRERIGYVAQDTFLFNDTVRANLLWARPGASEADVWEALRSAAADRFVSELPQGLETVLGERGVRLSGGERQRLALARALLRRPSLLILDEATSNLDSENESRILRAIEDLRGEIAVLLITHRLSAVGGADTIYVLDCGRVVESGTWEELTSLDRGRFRELCRAQGLEATGAADGQQRIPALRGLV